MAYSAFQARRSGFVAYAAGGTAITAAMIAMGVAGRLTPGGALAGGLVAVGAYANAYLTYKTVHDSPDHEAYELTRQALLARDGRLDERFWPPLEAGSCTGSCSSGKCKTFW